jgi:hypothetical protein
MSTPAPPPAPDRTNAYIAGIAMAGLACVAVMCIFAPAQIPVQMPALLVTVGGIIAVLQKMKETVVKVEDTTSKVDQVHEIVNSQRTVMESKIVALQKALADVKQSRAVERTAVEGVADPATKEAVAAARGAAKSADASDELKKTVTLVEGTVRDVEEAVARLGLPQMKPPEGKP